MPTLSARLSAAKREYGKISVLGGGGIIFALGNGAVWFLLPILAEKLLKDLTVVGLLLAIPYLISALLDIPVGGLSDHLGRKRFFVGGLIIMALLGMLLPSIGTLT